MKQRVNLITLGVDVGSSEEVAHNPRRTVTEDGGARSGRVRRNASSDELADSA